jgi:hypothetical protein
VRGGGLQRVASPLFHEQKQTEEMLNFVDGKGFVEDLGNGHSVMVMIPELIDLEANLDAPIPERFSDYRYRLQHAEEGH